MMNLRKTIIAGITCSLLPLVSQAAPDFYGRAWLGLSHSDSGLLSDRKENGAYLENYASFIGVKGKEKLNDNINIVYVMEFGNNGGYFDTSSLFKSRNTYLGVESQLGTLVFGRNDTVFKKRKVRWIYSISLPVIWQKLSPGMTAWEIQLLITHPNGMECSWA
ncbi:porin [Shewanella algae]|uniref:porin n=1 Tax=Shewanella algae TaxID=38313 RepID=UPI0021F075B5|nr:porin [Shewanella algae]